MKPEREDSGSAGALPEGELHEAPADAQQPPREPGTVLLYNTAARELEPLDPVEPGTVRLYVCGISVSGPPHVGHGRSYVVFDVLRRVLEHAGYEVHHVQNFTDIEEPIVRRARERGQDPREYALEMEEDYFDAMDKLDILHADAFPHVTEYIDDIITATQTLEDHECAYTIDDGVAFRVCDIQGFGQLLGRDPAKAIVHTVDDDQISGRESPFDFILWRNRDDVGITWETAWGKGRPGWHTECAVMATDLLGETIDIHGGGADLVFPHHESERAIARCLTGTDFVRHWVHNGLVRLEDDKMSKSLRNTVPLIGAIQDHGAATVRTAYLTAPYRETIEWNQTLVDEAHDIVNRLARGLEDAQPGDPSDPMNTARRKILASLRSDLDTPAALQHMLHIAHESTDEPGARDVLEEGLELLGLARLSPFHTDGASP